MDDEAACLTKLAENPHLFRCSFPGCTVVGDPWDRSGWCFWPKHYLNFPEGHFCPEHDTWIREGHADGSFADWPLDTSPEVLAEQEERAQWHDSESSEGRRILAGTVFENC